MSTVHSSIRVSTLPKGVLRESSGAPGAAARGEEGDGELGRPALGAAMLRKHATPVRSLKSSQSVRQFTASTSGSVGSSSGAAAAGVVARVIAAANPAACLTTTCPHAATGAVVVRLLGVGSCL